MVHYSEGVCILTNLGGSKKEEIGECVANEMLWIGLHNSNEDIQASTYLIPILHFQQTDHNYLQGQIKLSESLHNVYNNNNGLNLDTQD